MLLTSCKNGDVEFDNYDYRTVSFAYQRYVRTLQMGDDVYPTDDDNQHKFYIKATLGGDRNLADEHKIQIAVDNSLCDGLTFADNDGQPVLPMPTEYYTLGSNVITIPAGQVSGGVEVKLTDAFFADPKALDVTYVIPIRMVNAGNDSILSGTPKSTVANPKLQNASDWDVAPKNYALCAVKYKNKYDGSWISYGTDCIGIDGVETTTKREQEYLEKNDIRYISSLGLNSSLYALTGTAKITSADGTETTAALIANMILNVDDSGNVTITSDNKTGIAVPGSVSGGTYSYTATGTGTWKYQGAKKAWGDKDRDMLTLDYTVTFKYTDNGVEHVMTYKCQDNLVFRSHENTMQTFDVNYN